MWLPIIITIFTLSFGLMFSTAALAIPDEGVLEENSYSDGSSSEIDQEIEQVTSVSQLSDVMPSDWAFQALQSLVEGYGCIVGFPDSTYRGNQALTRYEFAAGLNACMQQMERLLANSEAVLQEDLEMLKRLSKEFEAELAALGTRVDNLEGRVAFLEDHQFSTTTKLSGEAIFAITDILTGDDNKTRVNKATTDTTPGQNAVFADRVSLDLQTSFSGRDLLEISLQAGNFNVPGFTIAGDGVFPDREGIQTFSVINSSPDSTACCISPGSGKNQPFINNAVYLNSLLYSFPIGRSTKVVVAASGGEHADYAPTLNPYFEDFDGGSGALSTFGQRSPIYRMGSRFGAGVGFTTQLNNIFSVSLGYLANGTGNLPEDNAGLFDGSYSVLTQLTISPSDRFSFALTYNYTYLNQFVNTNFAGVTGTKLATGNTFVPEDTYNDSFGIAATYRVSPGFVINGWVTTTNGRDFTIPRGSSDYYYTWSYALGLAFPDLWKKGNLGGLLVGVEPYLTGFTLDGANVPFQRTIPFHIEGFYRHQLTDNISLTAGVIWLTAPNQDSNNPDVVIGTLRTTFLF